MQIEIKNFGLRDNEFSCGVIVDQKKTGSARNVSCARDVACFRCFRCPACCRCRDKIHWGSVVYHKELIPMPQVEVSQSKRYYGCCRAVVCFQCFKCASCCECDAKEFWGVKTLIPGVVDRCKNDFRGQNVEAKNVGAA